MKIVQPLWTMRAYDGVVLLEAPDDETMSKADQPQSDANGVAEKGLDKTR